MDAIPILAQCRLFAGLEPAALTRLASLCAEQELAGGEPLFSAGDPADHLYIVVTGRLRALRSDGGVAGDISRFEPIGEISVITGEPRSGEVYALRDSVLLRIHREQLLAFVALYPSALLEMTRVLIGRLRQNLRPAALAAVRATQTLALVPADASVDMAAFAQRLRAGMPTTPALIDAAAVDLALGSGAAQTPFRASEANARLLDWLAWREAGGQRLLYCAGNPGEIWTERCLRQADRVVIVAELASPAAASPMPELLRRLKLRTPVELVVLRRKPEATSLVLGWRAACELAGHHLVQPESSADFARLARQLSGTGLGLVLGGGAARGFAHVGVIRALEALNLPVDLVGGSSMGAFFSALLAGGADSRELQRVARATFVDHNYLNDYVLPRVSLIRGRRFLTHLHSVFGERLIEDLPLPFFCISANLTRGTAMVHDQGTLAIWVATSMAVPGVAPPMVWHGDLLADGSIINSLPTDIMQAHARGPIFASDVSTEGALQAPGVEGPDPEALLKRSGINVSLSDILFRSATLTSESGVKARAARADLYVRMPVSRIGLFDWKRIDEVVERGYRHAMPELERHLGRGAETAAPAYNSAGIFSRFRRPILLRCAYFAGLLSTLNSTRRFSARPASVLLLAIGLNSP
ncbi:MAG: patatin-like phospholipase family protein [Nevskia sp.]